MNRIIGVTAALALALIGPAGLAQEDDAGGTQGTSFEPQQAGGAGDQGTQGNPSILAQVHEINLAEIQQGKLAEKNAKSQKVKDYGKMLVKDHEKADKEVKKEAKKMGVTLAGEQAADQSEFQQLEWLKGADFDRQFVKAEVDGHQKAISTIQDALPQTKNAGEKKTLEKIVPVLQKHLSKAQQLQKQMGASASVE